VEEDVRAQVEGVDGAVRTGFEALGDVRDHVQVLIEADQPGEDLDDVLGGTGVCGTGRVQRNPVAAKQAQLALDAIRQVGTGVGRRLVAVPVGRAVAVAPPPEVATRMPMRTTMAAAMPVRT